MIGRESRYEKKRGEESFWHAYISELDRLRARGPQAAESPLIWSDDEVAEYLRGSPVQQLVDARINSIREEYDCLDTVWHAPTCIMLTFAAALQTGRAVT
jgi:hypothetical protein